MPAKCKKSKRLQKNVRATCFLSCSLKSLSGYIFLFAVFEFLLVCLVVVDYFKSFLKDVVALV